jgi:hypothetical protein
MKSFLELAYSYESWATQNEAIANAIIGNLQQCHPNVRDGQLRQASLLVDDARSFRQHAARLRGFVVKAEIPPTPIPTHDLANNSGASAL